MRLVHAWWLIGINFTGLFCCYDDGKVGSEICVWLNRDRSVVNTINM
jgi:hypothetical protein